MHCNHSRFSILLSFCSFIVCRLGVEVHNCLVLDWKASTQPLPVCREDVQVVLHLFPGSRYVGQVRVAAGRPI